MEKSIYPVIAVTAGVLGLIVSQFVHIIFDDKTTSVQNQILRDTNSQLRLIGNNMNSNLEAIHRRLELQYATLNDMSTDKNSKLIIAHGIECLINENKKGQAEEFYTLWNKQFPDDLLD